MVNAALHRLSTVPPYPSCNLVIILHKDLTTLIAWPYFGLIAAWFRATSHLHAYNRKKKTQRNEQNCGQPCGLVYALPFPQKDVGNSQIPAVKLCRMCPSSTWRQQTYYQLLGLTFLASEDEIRVAYKRLALIWHPDRNPPCTREVAQDKFQAIQQAYSVLSRPDRRKAYHLENLDCWDMKEYLTNFRELLLTPSGLDLQPYSAERMLASIQHPTLLLSAA